MAQLNAVGFEAMVNNGLIDAVPLVRLAAGDQNPVQQGRLTWMTMVPRKGAGSSGAWPSVRALHSEIRRKVFG